VTKYRVEPGFYQAPLHTVINLDSWNSLTKAQQDLLSEVGLEFESRAETDGPAFQALLKKQNDKTLSQGLTAITLTGADREKWLSTAKTTGWAEVLERSPTHGPKLRELFSK
jgi:TRAP-type C4-dicarboxylate transport system substrate-binding protein